MFRHPVIIWETAVERQAGGRNNMNVLVNAIVIKTPILSYDISGEKTIMVYGLKKYLQEWWFDEHLMT